jgi:glycosyltransferase involved in cell wall biosynthesis
MWPDIFPPLAPAFARPLARAALWPYFRLSRLALRNASAIVGITDEFVEWGLKCAGRERTQWDRAFPMGYPSAQPTESEQQRARELWRSRGVTADDSKFKIAFAGTIGRQFEFEAALEAARLLGPEFQFILCGAGDRYADLQSLCRDVPNVILTGWIGADEIWTLMRIANVGLAPYHSEESFTLSLPNKSLEYLSAGMPVVSSLSGTLERLLAEQRCGFTYPNRDAAALAAFLKRLRLEPRLYAEMAANANRLFDARFRAEAVYSEMAEHLENLVSAKRY